MPAEYPAELCTAKPNAFTVAIEPLSSCALPRTRNMDARSELVTRRFRSLWTIPQIPLMGFYRIEALQITITSQTVSGAKRVLEAEHTSPLVLKRKILPMRTLEEIIQRDMIQELSHLETCGAQQFSYFVFSPKLEPRWKAFRYSGSFFADLREESRDDFLTIIQRQRPKTRDILPPHRSGGVSVL